MEREEELMSVDRRAAHAVGALDEAVARVPVPEPTSGSGPRARRRWLPLAAAAVLVVAAFVAAGTWLGGDDEQGTVAGEPDAVADESHTQLALPDPEVLGYRVVGAFPAADEATGPATSAEVRATVQVPAGATDPWPTTVVEWTLPSDITTLDGEPVDVGGPDATLDTTNAPPTVGWTVGDEVRYLRSADLPPDDLVDLAASAVSADTAPGTPLPGHDVLHTGPFVDVFPMLVATVGNPPGRISGIVYEADDHGMVVAATSGSPARWRASYALAERVDDIEVRGRPARLAHFVGGLEEASWLEADGTLVRVESLQGDLRVDVLDRLEPISDQDLAALVAEHGGRSGAPSPSDGGAGEEEAAETPIARVETSEGDVTFSASVLSGGRRQLELRTFTEGPNAGSGGGQSLSDLATNAVARDLADLGNGDVRGTLLAGIIGPDVAAPQVVDATTGEVITDGTGPLTATLPDSAHVLFLAVLPPGFESRDLVVVGTTAAGEEVRLPAPAAAR